MPLSNNTLGSVVILLAAISWQQASLTHAQNAEVSSAESPRAVVARWLELHRNAKRDDAAKLTTRSFDHRVGAVLPATRDTGLRVVRSLGNERAAAVVTNTLDDAQETEQALLFWLVRRDGVWRINKSELQKRQVVDERLLGFMEAGEVRWDVHRDLLVGNWEAGPCTPPGGDGLACGSRLQLGDDKRYQLVSWGPFGPDPEHDDVIQGKWRVANGRILLSHRDRTYECPVTWMGGNQLEIESTDGKMRVVYKRKEADKNGPGADKGKLDRLK